MVHALLVSVCNPSGKTQRRMARVLTTATPLWPLITSQGELALDALSVWVCIPNSKNTEATAALTGAAQLLSTPAAGILIKLLSLEARMICGTSTRSRPQELRYKIQQRSQVTFQLPCISESYLPKALIKRISFQDGQEWFCKIQHRSP
jgi:hypothetical protein